jgi:hypothetical protein
MKKIIAVVILAVFAAGFGIAPLNVEIGGQALPTLSR